MSNKFDVAILGGGVVGQTLALLLARERLRVALVTHSPAPPAANGPDIRAYALNLAARTLLESVRAWPGPDAQPAGFAAAVTPVRRMWISEPVPHDPAALHFDSGDVGAEALSWIVDVPALERSLAQAVSYQPGIERLSDRPVAALTVVCEGKRSATREALGIEFDTRPYPQTAVAVRLRCERPHGCVARQWFLHGDILALLPLEGEQGNSVALVWSVNHERARQLTDMSPQDLAAAVQQACDHALGGMQIEGQAAAWPLELSRARHWVQPGLALAGDAAHAMHPLAGQGLNVGLGDAAELARVLRERESWRDLGDLRLLRRYERARQFDVRAMSCVTEGLQGLFGHTDERIQALRRWGLRGFDRLSVLKHWAARQAMNPGRG